MERWQLDQLEKLPLEIKILKSKQRIREWYEHFNSDVYVSFSGGKDSTVLLHLVRSIYPDVVAVFADTGLEYPEIKDFVRLQHNVTIIKPEKNFKQIIQEDGYPVISKEIAYTIRYAKKQSEWAIKRLNGQHNYGNHKKYKYLLDAPFLVSDKCCDYMKKIPFKKYEKISGLKPIIGTMCSEGGQRRSAYLKSKEGCNAFNTSRPMSKPMSFWTEQDVLSYIKKYNVQYCDIYGEIIEVEGKLKTSKLERTGCMFCMFGVHLEQNPNRFQIMKETHPNIHEYCINKLGCGKVLDYIGVEY